MEGIINLRTETNLQTFIFTYYTTKIDKIYSVIMNLINKINRCRIYIDDDQMSLATITV